MVAKYSHGFHTFKNLMKLLGINQLRAIDLGHLIYFQILGYSAQRWCVCLGQGLSSRGSMGFCLPHWGVLQDFHWRPLSSAEGKYMSECC